MELRSLRILALGMLGLAAALLFPIVQGYFLFTMALTPLVLLVLGQFFLPRSKRIIQVWFNATIPDDEDEPLTPEPGSPFLRLSGKDLPYSFFKQWHEFKIVTHRFWLLSAIGFMSLLMVWLAWRIQDSFMDGAALFYLAGSLWMLLVTLASRWGWERRMLQCEGIAMAGFSAERSTGLIQRIRYNFVDHEGHYWGGIFASMFCDRKDDLTIIFYDERNPQQSVPASALIFHKLVWKDTSAVGTAPARV